MRSASLREKYNIENNEAGKITWHSLKEDGTINLYDIKFKNVALKNIPAALLEAKTETDVKEHKHKTVGEERD